MLGFVAGGGRNALVDVLVRPGVILGLLIAIIGLGIYHIIAIQDAYRLGLRRGRGDTGRALGRRLLRSTVFVGALAVAVTLYSALAVVGLGAYRATTAIFVKPDTGFTIPEPSFEPTASPIGPEPTELASPEPTPTPIPVPAWAADGRLNLLLIGSDAGPGRWQLRSDTMIVLSVDVATARAALFGIPRNIVNVPLPPESAGAFKNGRYPEFLNSLYVYAIGHPRYFPGGEAAGFRALTGAIQELVGVPLDGVLVVNLTAFVDLIDAVGGLWIDVPYTLYDEHYPGAAGQITVFIPAGCQKLDGTEALEYARSRHSTDDYSRMARQQLVLKALAHQLDPIALLPKVPKLLDVARDNLWTTIDQNDVANLAVLAARVDSRAIRTVMIQPPTFPEYLDTASIRRAQATVRSIFDAAPTSTPSSGPKSAPKPCPRPK